MLLCVITGIERIPMPNKKEPIFKRTKDGRAVIKFLGEAKGRVVLTTTDKLETGQLLAYIPRYTDTEWWDDVVYNKSRKLFDGKLIWCFESKNDLVGVAKFYDAVNNCTFDEEGKRGGSRFKYYDSYDGKMPAWALKAYPQLEI